MKKTVLSITISVVLFTPPVLAWDQPSSLRHPQDISGGAPNGKYLGWEENIRAENSRVIECDGFAFNSSGKNTCNGWQFIYEGRNVISGSNNRDKLYFCRGPRPEGRGFTCQKSGYKRQANN